MKAQIMLTWAFLSVLVTVWEVKGQSIYFPSDQSRGFSTQPQQTEELGNFFNGNGNLLPSTAAPSSQPQIYQQQQQQPQYTTFSSPQPPSFGFGSGLINSNYISPPAPSSSIPRQTHFFGNNYDFFRQYHTNAPPQQPRLNFNFGGPSFTTPNVVAASPSAAPAVVTAGTPTASAVTPAASFASTQFFGSSSPFTPTSFASLQPSPTQSSFAQVRQPPVQSQNALYNGYEEAAKALGLSHGLRVVTTETLKSQPIIHVQHVPRGSAEVSTSSPLSPSSTTLEPSTPTTEATIDISSTQPSSPSPSPNYQTTTTRQPIRHQTRTPVRIISTTTTPPPPTTTTSRTTTFRPFVVEGEEEPVYVLNHRQPLQSHQQQSYFVPQHQQPQQFYNPFAEYRRPTSIATPPPTTTTTPTPTPRPTAQSNPLYNANQLVPGKLYSNTNGAYHAYYGPGGPGHLRGGLEEIEPQIVDFTIPQKMIPLLEEHTQSDDPFTFNAFGPPPQHLQARQQPAPVSPARLQPDPPPRPRISPSPSPVAIIVTEASRPVPTPAPTLPAPSPSIQTLVNSEGQVYRVGPKGRILKKRKKVKANKQLPPQAPIEIAAASPVTQSFGPTTFRPQFAVSAEESEDNIDSPQPPTTYRSRFRYSPTTTTTTESSSSAGAEAGSSDTNKQQLIQSRLKSLERQIRFKNRSKNA